MLASIYAKSLLVNDLKVELIHVRLNITYTSVHNITQGDKDPVEVIILSDIRECNKQSPVSEREIEELAVISSEHYQVIVIAKVLLVDQTYALVITEHMQAVENQSHPIYDTYYNVTRIMIYDLSMA